MPNVLTVGPAGKSGASVSQTAIVSVYLDKVGGAHAPARGRAVQWAERQEAEPRTHPSEGQRPRGWQQKGRAEARNASAEPRREVEQRSSTHP